MKRRSGFTLVEILIVVVIMAILAATIIPQFSDSTKDAKTSSATFNLQTPLRSQIELYKAQHDGKLPSGTLAELMARTNAAGTIGTTAATFPYGPYLKEMPDNPFTKSATVKAIATDPAAAGDVTTTHGWIYSTLSGGIWINDATLVTE